MYMAEFLFFSFPFSLFFRIANGSMHLANPCFVRYMCVTEKEKKEAVKEAANRIESDRFNSDRNYRGEGCRLVL